MDPDAQDYFDRGVANGGVISTPEKDAINDFVVGLKADGVWSVVSDAGILAGWINLAGALTPLKTSAGIYSLVNTGPFTDSDYIATGPGSGVNNWDQLRYLNSYGGGTTKLLTAGSIAWSTNAAMGIYGSASSGGAWIANTGGFPVIYQNGLESISGGAYSFAGADFLSFSGRCVGDTALIRESLISLKLCQRGVQIASTSGASSSFPSAGELAVVTPIGGNAGGCTQFYFYAPGMNFAGYQKLHARVITLLAALGISTGQLSVVYEGDSNQWGHGVGVIPMSELLAIKPRWDGRHINIARNGETVDNCITQYPVQAGFLRPDSVHWMQCLYFANPCTNDLVAGDSAETVFARLQTLWGLARADGYKVIAETPLPRADVAWDGAKQAQMDALTLMIVGAFSDWDALMRWDLVFPDPTTSDFQSDKLHLSQSGQQKRADWVYSNLDPYTLQPPINEYNFGEINEWQCLLLWATRIGANPSGGENELQLLQMIAAKY